jgi:hypothetical protein
MITLRADKKTRAYYTPRRWNSLKGEIAAEIALNPRMLRDEPAETWLMELVHNLVHHWQHVEGTAGRARYHNRDFVERMKSVGLDVVRLDQAASAGAEKDASAETKKGDVERAPEDGRKRRKDRETAPATGDCVTHTPIKGGLFEKAVSRRGPGTFQIPWAEAQSSGPPPRAAAQGGKRAKFVCPANGCIEAAWSRPGARLKCGVHDLDLNAQA